MGGPLSFAPDARDSFLPRPRRSPCFALWRPALWPWAAPVGTSPPAPACPHALSPPFPPIASPLLCDRVGPFVPLGLCGRTPPAPRARPGPLLHCAAVFERPFPAVCAAAPARRPFICADLMGSLCPAWPSRLSAPAPVSCPVRAVSHRCPRRLCLPSSVLRVSAPCVAFACFCRPLPRPLRRPVRPTSRAPYRRPHRGGEGCLSAPTRLSSRARALPLSPSPGLHRALSPVAPCTALSAAVPAASVSRPPPSACLRHVRCPVWPSRAFAARPLALSPPRAADLTGPLLAARPKRERGVCPPPQGFFPAPAFCPFRPSRFAPGAFPGRPLYSALCRSRGPSCLPGLPTVPRPPPSPSPLRQTAGEGDKRKRPLFPFGKKKSYKTTKIS
ncbi:hypothetical protein HMPREF0262_00567 [Clostridium sp. ATCC 29733]|nr:hypothetical protein HMPREF0262_00567 [Clostridium sp. ATCC 29733]